MDMVMKNMMDDFYIEQLRLWLNEVKFYCAKFMNIRAIAGTHGHFGQCMIPRG